VTNELCETATSAAFAVTEDDPLATNISGENTVPFGGTTTLTANVEGGSGSVSGYEWRDESSTIVGTGSTLEAGAGTYTVRVNDSTCGSATSAPFPVTSAPAPAVPSAP